MADKAQLVKLATVVIEEILELQALRDPRDLLGLEDLLEQAVHQENEVILGILARQACLVLMEHLVRRDLEAPLVKLASQVWQARLAQLDPKDNRDQPDHEAVLVRMALKVREELLVKLVQQAQLGQRDRKEVEAKLVPQERQGQQDPLVQLGPLGLKASAVQLVQLDHQANQGLKEKRELLVRRDQLDLKVHRAREELKATEVKLEQLVPLEDLEMLAKLVSKVFVDLQEKLDQLGLLDNKVCLGFTFTANIEMIIHTKSL
jgi:hypothetical protein